jgi:predicted Zn-dependent protease
MDRRWMFRLVPIALAVGVVLWRFGTAERFTNPETGERHRVGLTTGQEAALGAEAFRDVLAESQTLTSGPEVDEVRRVVTRLTAAIGAAGADMDWQAAVIRSPTVNAFCLPGGKIAVYTGILPVCGGDAGLATVLGHEMAHAISRHGAQRVFQQENAQALLTGAAASLGDMDYNSRRVVMGLLGAGANYGVLLPFSRDHESEADHIGLIYMARAGYDPHEAVDFWQRMESIGGEQPPEFASTHPSHGTRIRQLKEWMPEAEAARPAIPAR